MKVNIEGRLRKLEQQSGANEPLYICKDDRGYWINRDCFSREELKAKYPGRRWVIVKIITGVSYADLEP